jgi:hypothetical protein
MRQEDEPMGEVGDRNVHGVETDVSSGGDKNVDDVRVVEDIKLSSSSLMNDTHEYEALSVCLGLLIFEIGKTVKRKEIAGIKLCGNCSIDLHELTMITEDVVHASDESQQHFYDSLLGQHLSHLKLDSKAYLFPDSGHYSSNLYQELDGVDIEQLFK